MYQIFTYPRDGYDETALNKELIYKLIRKHTLEAQPLTGFEEILSG